MILVPANKVEKIKYFSTFLGLIFIEITRGPFRQNTAIWMQPMCIHNLTQAQDPGELRTIDQIAFITC